MQAFQLNKNRNTKNKNKNRNACLIAGFFKKLYLRIYWPFIYSDVE